MSLRAGGFQFIEKSNIKDGKLELNSRFGKVEVDINNSIYFPSGVFGMPQDCNFCLTDLPIPENCSDSQANIMKEFKLLQCLNNESLSFIVMALGVENNLIAEEDIEEACQQLQFDINNVLIVLIAHIHNRSDDMLISVNLKAPIIIDSEKKLGVQYIFTFNKYEVRHIIN